MDNFNHGREQPQSDPQLKKRLSSWQIFFIAISGVIGTGLFSTNGGVLALSGPAGYILAMGIVGLIAICFMDCLSEMVQAFPCANALPEYVEAFVDPELATCIGVGYWLVWGIFWALMIEGAARDVIFFNPDLVLRVTVYFIILPVVMIAVNLCSVSIFGWIETLGGSLKILAIIAVSLAIFYLAGESKEATAYIQKGFKGSQSGLGTGASTLAALPLVAYSWIGLEIIAVTAFEAKQLKNLKTPSQAIVFCVLTLYLICAIGESLAIPSSEEGLPSPVGNSQKTEESPLHKEQAGISGSQSNSITLAAINNGELGVARMLNSIMIYCAVSAGNTSLYVASRSLYGFALKKKARNYIGMAILSRVNRFGVPWCAVLATAAAFIWIPFLQLLPAPAGLGSSDVGSIPVESDKYVAWLGPVASLIGLIVWSTVFGAYIRYYHWLKKFRHDDILEKEFPELNRFTSTGRAQTLLGFAQPFLAYFGFFATCVLILIFSSASWWQKDVKALSVTQTFAAPLIMLAAWLCLKLARWYYSTPQYPFEWYARRYPGRAGLRDVLIEMKFLSGEPFTSKWPNSRDGEGQGEPMKISPLLSPPIPTPIRLTMD